MNAWSTAVLDNGVRMVEFCCPGCRTVTSWDVSDSSGVPVSRCCSTGTLTPFPITEPSFRNFLRGRRPADSGESTPFYTKKELQRMVRFMLTGKRR
jgi:hypothetical protein